MFEMSLSRTAIDGRRFAMTLVQAGGKEPGPIREPGMMRHPYLTGTKDGYTSSTESVAEQRGAE